MAEWCSSPPHSLVFVPVEFFVFRLLLRSRLLGGGSVLWPLFDQPERQCWTRPETKTIKIKLTNSVHLNTQGTLNWGEVAWLRSHDFLSYSPTVTQDYQKGQNCIADELYTCKVAKWQSEGCWPFQIKRKLLRHYTCWSGKTFKQKASLKKNHYFWCEKRLIMH